MSDDRPAVMSNCEHHWPYACACSCTCKIDRHSTAPDVTPEASERDNTTGTKE